MSRLAFLHIPKTAGTAVMRCAIQSLGRDKVFRIGDDCTVEEWADGAIDPTRLADRLVVGGHTTAEALSRVDGISMRATLIRDPVERVASHYQYIRTVRAADRIGRRIGSKPLVEALELPSFRELSANDQCRRIAGVESADAAIERIRSEGWIVYPSDRVGDLLQDISRHFGWSLRPVERANASEDGYLDRVLTDEARETIRSLNVEDLKLWQSLTAHDVAA